MINIEEEVIAKMVGEAGEKEVVGDGNVHVERYHLWMQASPSPDGQ